MKNASVSSCGVGQDCTHTKTLPLYNSTIMIWHAKIRGKFEEGGRKRQFDFILLSSAQPFLCEHNMVPLHRGSTYLRRYREG